MKFNNIYNIGDISTINSKSLKKGHDLSIIEYLDTSSVTENEFDNPEVLSFGDLPSRAKRIVEDQDIIISTVRPNLKHFGFIKEPKLNLIVSTGFAVITCNKLIVSPRYLYYFISLETTTKYLSTIADGSTTAYPSIKPSVISELSIDLPPLETQKKIAYILSTLDDKIELNRTMNKTLEDMAQTIFKSWFVDFDPVHAKANCANEKELEFKAKELGISKEVLDLFPSEFEESELGMIPKGWGWKKFGEVLIPKKGKVITKKTITEGSIPVVAGGLSPAYYHNKSNAKSPVITVSASGANAGFVNLYTQDIWASDCSYINENMTDFVYTMYLFLSLNQKKITRMQQGAAQPHIYPSDLMRLIMAKPNNKLWEFFEETISPIFQKIKNNKSEISTLQKTRDTLLPKLLSGEVDVENINISELESS